MGNCRLCGGKGTVRERYDVVCDQGHYGFTDCMDVPCRECRRPTESVEQRLTRERDEARRLAEEWETQCQLYRREIFELTGKKPIHYYGIPGKLPWKEEVRDG